MGVHVDKRCEMGTHISMVCILTHCGYMHAYTDTCTDIRGPYIYGICMNIRAYIRAYTDVCPYTRIRIYTYTYMCTCTDMCPYIRSPPHTEMYGCMRTYTVYVVPHAYIHTRIHAHIYRLLYMYIYGYMRILFSPPCR
jgi:hypothetical protein